MLEILPGDELELAAEVVGRALANSDPVAAELIAAEAVRLRTDDDAARAAEAALLAHMAPHQPGYRAQISLYDLFDEQVTVLHGGPRDHLWAYDEDIVGLVDGIGAQLPAAERAEFRRDPWAWNTAAADELGRVLRGSEARRLGSIRLMAFEGAARFAAVVAEHDAAHLVSHLVLRSDRQGDDRPVTVFPRLRGLAVDEDALALAVRDGAPELRSLVVQGTTDVRGTLAIAARLPSLRHLGLWYGAFTPDDLGHLASSALMGRLTSLELFTVNEAMQFPFEVVASLEPFRGLRRLGLPGHLVPDEARAHVAGLRSVDIVSHARRERLAFDIETIGWAENMR